MRAQSSTLSVILLVAILAAIAVFTHTFILDLLSSLFTSSSTSTTFAIPVQTLTAFVKDGNTCVLASNPNPEPVDVNEVTIYVRKDGVVVGAYTPTSPDCGDAIPSNRACTLCIPFTPTDEGYEVGTSGSTSVSVPTVPPPVAEWVLGAYSSTYGMGGAYSVDGLGDTLFFVDVLGWIGTITVDGQLGWARSFSATPLFVKRMPDNNLLIVGTIDNNGFLLRVDTQGAFISALKYVGIRSDGLPDTTSFSSAVEVPAGGFVIVGESEAFGDTLTFDDPVILSTRTDGVVIWARSIDVPSTSRLYDVDLLPDGNFVAAGESNNTFFAILFTGAGTILKAMEYYLPTSGIAARSVVALPDGSYVLGGGPYIVRASSDGNVIWAVELNGWDIYGILADTNNSALFVTGDRVVNFNTDVGLAKVSIADGSVVGALRVGRTDYEEGITVVSWIRPRADIVLMGGNMFVPFGLADNNWTVTGTGIAQISAELSSSISCTSAETASSSSVSATATDVTATYPVLAVEANIAVTSLLPTDISFDVNSVTLQSHC